MVDHLRGHHHHLLIVWTSMHAGRIINDDRQAFTKSEIFARFVASYPHVRLLLLSFGADFTPFGLSSYFFHRPNSFSKRRGSSIFGQALVRCPGHFFCKERGEIYGCDLRRPWLVLLALSCPLCPRSSRSCFYTRPYVCPRIPYIMLMMCRVGSILLR